MKTFRDFFAQQEQLRGTNERQSQIDNLKEQLEASDYKVIKCAECSMADKEAPYDISALHKERQAARDRINILEKAIGALEGGQ